jgi:transcriptional regulator with GAF, ATPase, and Fis domain
VSVPQAPAVGTAQLEGRVREYVFRAFKLTVLRGPDKGASVPGGEGELSIGTAPGNRLVVTDSTVSRHHCVLFTTPAGVEVRDLGSTNGTLLGGFRVGSALLRTGATLELGTTSILYEECDEVHAVLSADTELLGMLGHSASMRRLFATLPTIAASEATVLIEGETGTGKELLAEAIHRASPRGTGPLVVVDCGAIPARLVESELFGHEKGAFTGAHTTRIGAFESADGGTVLLDEIGELPLDLQPRLLRVLEARTVKRVGGSSAIPLDVRLLCATNRDLREMVNQRTFRADLYYRLDVVKLRVPPLRERPEDIPPLVELFHRQLTGQEGPPPAELVATLVSHRWPGNVRELRAAVERAVLLGDALGPDPKGGGAATVSGDEALFDDPQLSYRSAKERAMARWECWFVEELIRRNEGNQSRAARQARMDRNYLRELLRRYGLLRRSDPDG